MLLSDCKDTKGIFTIGEDNRVFYLYISNRKLNLNTIVFSEYRPFVTVYTIACSESERVLK